MGRITRIVENIRLRYSNLEIAGIFFFLLVGAAFLLNQDTFDNANTAATLDQDETKSAKNILLYDSRSHIKTINLYPVGNKAE